MPKCKKVIAWSGNFRMDQYVSWGLSKEEMNLDTVWERFEDFCKLQSNEVHAQFDLLTSFCQGNKSMTNGTMLYKCKLISQSIPQDSKNILCFFLWDEDFMSRTITEGSVDLDKFSASRVRQLVKKLVSSKATACHIKQVVGNLQASQINLLQH